MGLRREFEKWKKDNAQVGTGAWARYAMFEFIKATNEVSSEYILKGGHLLWKKIKIKRTTTDLDYAIRKLEIDISEDLNRACSLNDKFEFVIESIKKRTIKESPGFSVVVCFREKELQAEEKRYTEDGRLIGYSKFTIDVGLDPGIEVEDIMVDGKVVKAASATNIFLDKLDSCTRRGPENTRIKDFDDLVQIITSGIALDPGHLRALAGHRGIPLKIRPDLVDPNFSQIWARYMEIQYQGKPPGVLSDPVQAIEFINKYLSGTSN